MPKQGPPSIEDIGLKEFLDSTKDKHNGLGYDDITQLFEFDVNYANISHKVNADWRRVKEWKIIWIKEKEN